MLSFLDPDPYQDARLGTFKRHRGRWIGALELAPHGSVELRITGGRKAPAPESLDAAASLASQYAALSAQVAAALYDHYEPGWEAWKNGELEGLVDSFPTLETAADVWANVRVTWVDLDPARRHYPVEIRLSVAWDEEHTLGVRIDGTRLVELCGSVGP